MAEHGHPNGPGADRLSFFTRRPPRKMPRQAGSQSSLEQSKRAGTVSQGSKASQRRPRGWALREQNPQTIPRCHFLLASPDVSANSLISTFKEPHR